MVPSLEMRPMDLSCWTKDRTTIQRMKSGIGKCQKNFLIFDLEKKIDEGKQKERANKKKRREEMGTT
uniref:Uncharacterized protein n=1 Tax=Onchocerca volvulus TaxID=6282 RepID=A0A8R1TZX0_ONCVO